MADGNGIPVFNRNSKPWRPRLAGRHRQRLRTVVPADTEDVLGYFQGRLARALDKFSPGNPQQPRESGAKLVRESWRQSGTLDVMPAMAFKLRRKGGSCAAFRPRTRHEHGHPQAFTSAKPPAR